MILAILNNTDASIETGQSATHLRLLRAFRVYTNACGILYKRKKKTRRGVLGWLHVNWNTHRLTLFHQVPLVLGQSWGLAQGICKLTVPLILKPNNVTGYILLPSRKQRNWLNTVIEPQTM